MPSRDRPLRDSAATRKRILEAGTAEFAERGLAGARIASIVESAEVNPRMVYAHFGSKEGLFRAVIEHAVHEIRSAVTLTPTDLVGYALAVFDAHAAEPELIRLALWQELESPGMAAQISEVQEANDGKTELVAQAQRDGYVTDKLPADELLDALLALVYGNLILTERLGDFSDSRREAVRRAVSALVDGH